jgi:hypothetical protein
MYRLKNMIPWGISLTTEQQSNLDSTAEALIVYVDNVFIIKAIYDEIKYCEGIASPYLNFRDALFHFKKMYDSANLGNNTGVLQQMACIDEHLNRGIKDFVTNLCSNFYIPVIHKLMLSPARCITIAVFQQLRHIYHELKNIVADIRLGGQLLLHFNDSETHWLSRTITAVENFKLLLENPQVKNLYSNIVEDIES